MRDLAFLYVAFVQVATANVVAFSSVLPLQARTSLKYNGPLHLYKTSDDPVQHTANRSSSSTQIPRRNLLKFAASSAVFLNLGGQRVNALPEQKSYSSNARNFDRLANGDSSGGSLYNNSPSSTNAAKRRAMVGCKVDASRREAMKMEGLDKLSEKECNLKVMDGDSEFMLKALRELDCDTCPYGISGA